MKPYTIKHPNKSGTGTALSIKVCEPCENDDGGIFVSIMPQMTLGAEPTFLAGSGATTTFLDVSEVGRILEVLRGMEESVNDGKGLVYSDSWTTEVVKFCHRVEPKPGYLLEISSTGVDGTSSKGSFFIDIHEAVVLMLGLENSIPVMMFGR